MRVKAREIVSSKVPLRFEASLFRGEGDYENGKADELRFIRPSFPR